MFTFKTKQLKKVIYCFLIEGLFFGQILGMETFPVETREGRPEHSQSVPLPLSSFKQQMVLFPSGSANTLSLAFD